ncbi:MAG: prolipoprotein diacylglyceryl transferase [Omnitrophica bacterium GWA2_52_8]|nr:MAG: prolipoprotein diacylglyceryl transferase [Omnitrophica bacterium GWA2_52_8]
MDNFLQAWQTFPLRLDPVFLRIGGLQLRYYGVMFLSAVLMAYFLSLLRVRRGETVYSIRQVDDYYTWVIFGVVAGGRLGYVLFYNAAYYLHNPLEIFLPFDMQNGFRFTGISGMSFHGGFLGVILVTYFFCRKQKISTREFLDFLIPAVPGGYIFGRLGNFLNGELFGRPTAMPWGMYFPADESGLLRHPSQLYEAFFEGLVLFVLLWSLRRKPPFAGFLFALYVFGYGFVRFFIEYTREPDAQLGLVFGPFTMGQGLCFLMAVSGLGLMALWRRTVRKKNNGRQDRRGKNN